MRAETENGLNWFVCVWPVYNCIYFCSLPLLLCVVSVATAWTCTPSFFYISFHFSVFCSRISHSFCPVCRFIKQNEERERARKKCLFQCVLLFIINTRRSINTQTILNHSLHLYIRCFLFFFCWCRGRCRSITTKIRRTNDRSGAHTKENRICFIIEQQQQQQKAKPAHPDREFRKKGGQNS